MKKKWMLLFLFKDQQDCYLDEEQFYSLAVQLENGAEKVEQILRNFLQHFKQHGDEADPLYRFEDEFSL